MSLKSAYEARAGHALARRWLTLLAWSALAYNVLVILWGAYVRISGSGAGCGEHWPLCDGQVIPRSFTLERVVEFSHRATSGLSGLLALGVAALGVLSTPKGHPVRTGAFWSLGLIIFEGVVGGVQVLLGLTADSTNPARGFVQGVHLVNTFALLGALLLTALWSSGAPRLSWRAQGWLRWAAPLALGLMLLLGMAGAVTALGDKLFVPAPGTPLDTVRQDFSASASLIQNLRVIHPVLAIGVSAYLVWLAGRVTRERPSAQTQRWSVALYSVIGAQMVAGFLNVALKAPGWLQLTHLLLACVMWLVTVRLCFAALVTQPGASVRAVAA